MIRQLFAGQWPEAVLFDLDGTLIDSVPDLALAVDQMLEQLDQAQAGLEQVRLWVGNGAQMLVRRALVNAGLYTHEQIDTELEANALAIFKQCYGKVEAKASTLYPNVIEALTQLQQAKVKMALVTNKPIEFTRPLLQHFGLAPFFSVVLGGECLSEKKPHPMPLLNAVEQLGVNAGQCVMVGDSINDIAAAQAANIKVVAVDYGYHQGVDLSQQGCDLYLSDMGDLAQV